MKLEREVFPAGTDSKYLRQVCPSLSTCLEKGILGNYLRFSGEWLGLAHMVKLYPAFPIEAKEAC